MSQAGAQCPSCKAPRAVSTGVLTPVPGADAETIFSPPAAPTDIDSEATIFGAAPSTAADAETLFRAPGTPPPPTSPAPQASTLVDSGDTTGLPASAGGIRHAPPSKSATGPLQLGQQFSPRYIIVRLLGIGGMGAVYQAWDAELSVMVALKVVRPEVTRNPVAARDIERRFKQELLLARQVTHKNVVRIHDMGEIDGIKYITMPYIEGEDLASVLKKTPRLPVTSVMPIARQVAAGLQAAHQASIVHRDLKPANIMLEKGHEAIIMDFGIARSAAAAASPRAASAMAAAALSAANDEMTRAAATMAGSIVGTIEYMAPEQARGEDVDQRTDLYAFGLILYDMLVGRRRAGHDMSAIAELQQRLTAAPTRLSLAVPGIPQALDQLVSRCVEPDAAKRFQSTADLVAALARLDDNGKLRPIKRVVGLPVASVVAILLLALSAGVWWYTRPPVQHDPVAVVIADIVNRTGDPAFDRTLEPMLQRALEGASFISAYDRNAIRRTLGVQPPERLDEAAARGLAVNQGLGIVLAGSLEPEARGFRITLSATQAVTGNVIASAQGRAAGKDQVLDVATRLVTRVRRALGDEASESDQMFAMASLSTTSLDVVGHFAAAREAASNNEFDEALRRYERAVTLDPKFGLGYQGLANVSANLAKQQDAEKYIREALRFVSSMTERERLTTRGGFFRVTGDYQQCVKEYSDLIAAYPADVAARNNLAICLANQRNFSKAMDEVKHVVEILPNRALYRVNLASYANFSTEFQTAEREVRKVEKPDVNALMTLAFAQLGQGQPAQAADTYRKTAAISEFGASLAASGLADLANLEGRFSEAARILEQGAAEDLKSEQPDWAAAKFAALARTHLLRGQPRAAIAAGEQALMHSQALSVEFIVARVFVEAGAAAKARPLVAAMSKEVQAEPRAYAKIVEGEIALKEGDARQAIEALTQANGLLDTWLGHFDLGRAYFDAKQFTQADSEFERCLKRRGEALQLILGDEPTYALLPLVYYYQGRVREGQDSEGFADSYREYLKFRGQSTEDPLVPELRKRIGS